VATIHRFEDLECWQKARRLANAIYDINDKLTAVRDFALREQLRRSAISVMANIAEGFERGGAREFANFLAIARGSLAETKSHLYLACDRGHVTDNQLAELLALANEIVRQVTALSGYLQKTEFIGKKFSASMTKKPLGHNRMPQIANRKQ